MADGEQRFVVDLEAMRAHVEEFRAETAAEEGPQAGVSVARASAHIVENTEIEVRAGNFTFCADEPAGRGGKGAGPRPLQYFAAGVAT